MKTCVDLIELIIYHCDYCIYANERYEYCKRCCHGTCFAIEQIYKNNF